MEIATAFGLAMTPAASGRAKQADRWQKLRKKCVIESKIADRK